MKVEDNKLLKINQIKDLEDIDYANEQNLETKELNKTNTITSSDDKQINSEQKIITSKIDKQKSLSSFHRFISDFMTNSDNS